MDLIHIYGGSSTEENWLKYTTEVFTTKDDHDLVVLVGNKEKGDQLKEIKLHQHVLKSRIPDFAITFKHDSKEKQTKVVEISDYTYDVMLSFFEYAYCGTISNFNELVVELLKVADKYNFLALKELCSAKIAKNITTVNAAAICSIAFYAHADDLVKKTKEFLFKPENFYACRYENPTAKCRKERQSWLNLPITVVSDVVEVEVVTPKKRKIEDSQ